MTAPSNGATIVTGAASGIGAAIAHRLAADGIPVAVFDLAESGSTVAADIRAGGGEARAYQVNVASADEVDAAVNAVLEQFGSIDALVNNAGTSGLATRIEDGDEADFDQVIATSVKSVWLCLRAVLGPMREARRGAIVNIGSTAGLIGYSNKSAYTAAKHAVIGLTKVAALENLDIPIRVNCVCPGQVDTPMIRRSVGGGNAHEAEQLLAAREAAQPLGRLGKPDEIAALVQFLLSPAAGFLTGGTYLADGGLLAGH